MKTVAFYFDYSSPFAYLGATQVERVARETGARVEWRPFLLGALFKTVGTPLVPIETFHAAKQRHQRLDLYRWAAWWGVPFRWTSHFPLRTVDALRLTLLAPEDATADLVGRLMRAAWVDDEDIADRAVLSRCALDVGLDARLVERVAEPEIKARLKAATDEALDAGCPGAPCFVVGPHLYWGQDRLEFVRAALEGRPPAPEASPA